MGGIRFQVHWISPSVIPQGGPADLGSGGKPWDTGSLSTSPSSPCPKRSNAASAGAN